MRKNLFFKICLVLIIFWLFLFLYSNRYYYYREGGQHIKVNKFTGEVFLLKTAGWIKVAD